MVTADVLGKHTLNVEVRLSKEIVEKIDDRKPKRQDEKQRKALEIEFERGRTISP